MLDARAEEAIAVSAGDAAEFAAVAMQGVALEEVARRRAEAELVAGAQLVEPRAACEAPVARQTPPGFIRRDVDRERAPRELAILPRVPLEVQAQALELHRPAAADAV